MNTGASKSVSYSTKYERHEIVNTVVIMVKRRWLNKNWLFPLRFI